MGINDFTGLGKQEKEVIIRKSGTLLAKFAEGQLRCEMYELFEFYVALGYESDNITPSTITSKKFPESLRPLEIMYKLN